VLPSGFYDRKWRPTSKGLEYLYGVEA
jgi:hypothetical protein